MKSGLLGQEEYVHAVNGVSFSIGDQETLGLVGESGSGKSTTGRLILRLLEPTSGKILLEGKDISTISDRDFRKLRKELQIVFQNPYSALVYSASGRDVANVFIHGECIVRDGVHQFMDTTNVMLDAKSGLKKLLNRSGLIR